MKKTAKLSFFLFLFSVLVFSISVSFTSVAYEEEGSCGNNVYWSYDDEDCTLYISGDGDMYDYAYTYYASSAPWCNSLKFEIENVVVASGVTSIGDYSFYNCGNITSVTLPNTITYIGDYAFAHTQVLWNDSFEIPDSVTHIGNLAFCDCQGFEIGISLPKSLESLGDKPFAENDIWGYYIDENNPFFSTDEQGVLFDKNKSTLLMYPSYSSDDYTIPNSVTSIKESAFANSHIKALTLSENILEIEEYAFKKATIENLIMTETITNIADSAFSETVFKNLTIPTDFIHYFPSKSIENLTFVGDCIQISPNLFENNRSITTLTITDTEKILIDESAFFDCDNLTTVFIGESDETKIYENAFSNCYKLTTVSIGKSGETTIYDYAFSNCSNLTRVEINTGCRVIGKNAFYDCEILSTLYLPNSLSLIKESAFNGCYSLTNISYSGSEKDWENITIENNNTELKNIKFNSSSSKKENKSTDNNDFNPIIIAITVGIILLLIITLLIILKIKRNKIHRTQNNYTNTSLSNTSNQQLESIYPTMHKTNRFCSACGTPITENSNFCTHCGAAMR